MDKDIGKKMRLQRLINDISARELAVLMGISYQMYLRYEHGKSSMRASKLYEFSKIIKQPIGYFFE